MLPVLVNLSLCSAFSLCFLHLTVLFPVPSLCSLALLPHLTLLSAMPLFFSGPSVLFSFFFFSNCLLSYLSLPVSLLLSCTLSLLFLASALCPCFFCLAPSPCHFLCCSRWLSTPVSCSLSLSLLQYPTFWLPAPHLFSICLCPSYCLSLSLCSATHHCLLFSSIVLPWPCHSPPLSLSLSHVSFSIPAPLPVLFLLCSVLHPPPNFLSVYVHTAACPIICCYIPLPSSLSHYSPLSCSLAFFLILQPSTGFPFSICLS